ncbi:HAD-IA family hydrolase [Lactococcus nasutitermitis]|uniref:HAD-IA family hydrolase n=1 Tax=Lactococcus nasutitermitis TaxID=1652957 RepID=A0ABV9JD43_9LACT|nr:HAD-IA family hydrolase [Lactococcus nasutitermitis]
MKLRNYIWDFDGTLFDTYPVMLQALRQVMKNYSIEYDGDLEDFIKRYSIRKFADDYANVSFLESYHQVEHELQKMPKFYPEIPAILKNIVVQGGQNFVLSHRDHTTFEYLGNSKKFFTEIITSEENFARKPNPEALNYLIDKYGLERAETIMVGDRPLDIEAGKNAGILTLLLDENNIFGNIADRKIRKWSEF